MWLTLGRALSDVCRMDYSDPANPTMTCGPWPAPAAPPSLADGIIGLVVGLLRAVLSALPTFEVPTFLTTTAGGDLAASFGAVNNFFPLSALLACLGVLLGFRLLLGLWTVGVWLYDRFPFKMT